MMRRSMSFDPNNNIEIIYRKKIIFVDRNEKSEIKRFEYVQMHEEEKFAKQNVIYKDHKVEIMKEKVIYVDKLNELPEFQDESNKYISGVYQNMLNHFNKVII